MAAFRKRLLCDTPNCTNNVPIFDDIKRIKGTYLFCRECRMKYSSYVLVIQAQHGYEIREILLDAANLFSNVSGIAAYVGVSFVTVYNWLEKYFEMSFQEFKRMYICKSPKCYTLNIQGNTYSRYDYVLKKIKRQRYCACSSVLDKNQIMTNAPLSVIQEILRGGARLERITDASFILVPQPIKFLHPLTIDCAPDTDVETVHQVIKLLHRVSLGCVPSSVLTRVRQPVKLLHLVSFAISPVFLAA